MSPRDVDDLFPWEVAAILGLDDDADGGSSAAPDDGRGGLDVGKLGLIVPGTTMVKGA